MASDSAIRRIEDLLKRLRRGPRLLQVVVDTDEMVSALCWWARIGNARIEVSGEEPRFDVRVYLLPVEFGGHPLVAWRPAVPSLDATPEGIHLNIG